MLKLTTGRAANPISPPAFLFFPGLPGKLFHKIDRNIGATAEIDFGCVFQRSLTIFVLMFQNFGKRTVESILIPRLRNDRAAGIFNEIPEPAHTG